MTQAFTQNSAGLSQDAPTESPLISPWEKARDHILALVRLEPDWNGEEATKIRQDLIRSALHLAIKLESLEYSAPQDIYPLPDGNIIFEWQKPDGIIERLEVEGVGTGQRMISLPGQPTVFSDESWPTTVLRE